MNYLDIVAEGLERNVKSYSESYIYREWLKAEKKHYSDDEFFNGCLSVCASWKNIFEAAEIKEDDMCENALMALAEGRMHLNDGQTKEECHAYWKKRFHKCKGLKKKISISTSKFYECAVSDNCLTYSQVEEIEEAIMKAHKKHNSILEDTDSNVVREYQPKDVRAIIQKMSHTLSVVLLPSEAIRFFDDILNATRSNGNVVINQKVFNVYSEEATEIINFVEKDIDVNNPKVGMAYYQKLFSELFKLAKDFREIEMSAYISEYHNIIDSSLDDCVSERAREDLQKLKSGIEGIELQNYVLGLDILRDALLKSIDRIKQAFNEFERSLPTTIDVEDYSVYQGLRDVMSEGKFIHNVELNVLCSIIDKKMIQKKYSLVLWTGSKADTFRVMAILWGMTVKQVTSGMLNRVYYLPDGKPFHDGHKPKPRSEDDDCITSVVEKQFEPFAKKC